MKLEHLPLDSIVPAFRNPKDHDLGAIMESIRRFGFVAPAIRNEATGKLVAGHGRLQALRLLWENQEDPPEGIKKTKDGGWKLPVITGIEFASDEEAEAYLIADNRLTELGGWDEAELLDALLDLARTSSDLLEVTGYDTDDLEAMAARLAGLGSLPPEDENQDRPRKSVVCPHCGKDFEI
jgi:ParB-like chromosome segregation protein Spo0J